MQIRQFMSEVSPPKPTFTEADLPSLAGKTVLITGGASGVGKELARILYAAQATIYIAGRSLSNIEKAKEHIIAHPAGEYAGQHTSGEIHPVVLDLGDLTTIQPAVEELKNKISAIDVLFLNAGVMTPPKGSKTSQGHELQWGTNVIGHFHLQQLLHPLIRTAASRTGSSRIVWVASNGANFSPRPDGVNWSDINGEASDASPQTLYTQSKAGNIIVASESAKRFAADNIVVVSLNPGHLKTELQRHVGSCTTAFLNATMLFPPRFGALTELAAGFSDIVSKENAGAYLIPWGRIGEKPEHVVAGLAKGSGERLWDLLEKETAEYV